MEFPLKIVAANETETINLAKKFSGVLKPGNTVALIGRLEERLNAFNLENNFPYKLSISAGFVAFDSDSIKNIDELLEEADKLMYEQKKGKTEK